MWRTNPTAVSLHCRHRYLKEVDLGKPGSQMGAGGKFNAGVIFRSHLGGINGPTDDCTPRTDKISFHDICHSGPTDP